MNNTNGPKPGRALDKTTRHYQDAFDCCLKLRTIQYCWSSHIMQQQGFDRIINLTSHAVQEPADSLALANTIRSGTTPWANTLASAVGKHNITINNLYHRHQHYD